MKKNFQRMLTLGVMALAAASAAAAATIQSPVRMAHAPGAMALEAAVLGEESLELDSQALRALRNAGPSELRVTGFPITLGTTGTIVLKRFEVAAPDARITVTGPTGDYALPFPSIAHFSGILDGEPDSRVYVSAHAGRLVAYLQTSAGPVYVGPDDSETGYVLRTSDSPANAAAAERSWICGTEELPAPLTASPEASLSYKAALAPLAGLKQAAVRVETDQELLAKFGGDVSAMASYVATLYAAVNVIYERDLALHLAVSEVHAWTTTDPYPGPTTRDQLDQLGDWWHANRPPASSPRAIVHFLSGVPVSGGIAWLSVLCSGDFGPFNGHWGGAYGLTQVHGTYPLQFWDQMATAHEMGHNAGSPHTHCYSPPIDQCYNGEPGCYSGPTSVPPEKGTIMSYCHLLPGSYSNINLIFHTRCVSEKMLPEVNGASCLTAASTFLDVPPSHPFFSFVETLAANQVTGGCATNYYCPEAPVSRAQMAVFLLRSKYGAGYTPPPATGTVFADVHAGDFAAAWIEEIAKEGITGGCNVNPLIYCPADSVNRAQMAVFLLATKHGAGFAPAACTGIFTDAICKPVPSFAANYIEQLYNDGVTGGCSTNPLKYCPGDPVTRGQMAVFLVTNFGLVP